MTDTTTPPTGEPDDRNPTTRYPTPIEPLPEEPSEAMSDVTPPAEPPPAEPPPAEPPPADASAPASGAPVPPLQPSWQPRAQDQGRTASILFGLVMLGIGLWFFADQTLGLELPRIRWSQLWPLVLIVIGAWIAFGAMRRGSR